MRHGPSSLRETCSRCPRGAHRRARDCGRRSPLGQPRGPRHRSRHSHRGDRGRAEGARAAVERFDVDILRLRQLSESGQRRLAELRRGLEMGRAQEALRRAGANGRRAIVTGTGALREAEATLARIREASTKSDDYVEAREMLDKEASGKALDDRLSDAGFGPKLKTKPSDVLERLRRKQAEAFGPKA